MRDPAGFVIGAGDIERQAMFIDRIIRELRIAFCPYRIPCVFERPVPRGHTRGGAVGAFDEVTGVFDGGVDNIAVFGCGDINLRKWLFTFLADCSNFLSSLLYLLL